MKVRRHRIISIVGTRPEAIKMAPVARLLNARAGIDHRLVLTGQHAGLARYFDRPEACVRELDFDPRGRTQQGLRRALRTHLCRDFRGERIDLVLVQGDTTSAVAGAYAARDCDIPIGHVEAGLRSFDLRQPYPEEGHRIVIDRLAQLLFAPTVAAAGNLRADWQVKGEIHVTGNTGIDQLFHVRDRLPAADRRLAEDGRRLVLATCHRKENQGAPMHSICAALKRLTEKMPVEVVLPLHPNRHVRNAVIERLRDQPRIRLVEPLDHWEMVRLMAGAWLILTDSGGVQEEGAALGKPVLVLRKVTERPEGVESANLRLVGTEEASIIEAASGLFEDSEAYARMSRPSLAFGDGKAAPRIVIRIEQWLNGGPASAQFK